MAYQIQHLDTIAGVARMVVNRGSSPEAAVDLAVEAVLEDCADILAARRVGEWTTEKVEEHRSLSGVAHNVRDGFVSPSIGNVRQYVLDRI